MSNEIAIQTPKEPLEMTPELRKKLSEVMAEDITSGMTLKGAHEWIYHKMLAELYEKYSDDGEFRKECLKRGYLEN